MRLRTSDTGGRAATTASGRPFRLRAAGASAVVVWLLGPLAIAPNRAATQPAPSAKRVLLLTHNTFYNHSNLEAIETVLPDLGKAGGFTVTSLEGYKQTARCTIQQPCGPQVVDLSMLSRAYLAGFDAIVASTNGELPFSDEARAALFDFVAKDGKGIVFLHQSVVTSYGWKGWGELLGGYLGAGRILDPTNKSKRRAVMRIDDRRHPATIALPERWTLDDEFYQFAGTIGELGPTRLPVPYAFSRDKVRVLVSIDSHATDFSGVSGWSAGGDYPQVWSQSVGKGLTFYTAIGHRDDLWREDTVFRQFVTAAVRWVLRIER